MNPFQHYAKLLAIALAVAGSGTALGQTAVHFADPNLETAVRLALNQPTDELTASNLLALTSLSAGWMNITNLSGLEPATNLTYLYLAGNPLSDVTLLAGFRNLLTLDLSNIPLINGSVLAGLSQLSSLNLYRASLSEVGFLSGLTGLTDLGLADNQVRDSGPLAGLTNLVSVDLSDNPLTNCAGVGALSNLSRLFLGGCSITSLEFVRDLRRLSHLALWSNRATDLTPLSGLTNLETLELSGNSVTNCHGLEGLGGRLSSLNLSYNQLTDLVPLRGLTNLQSLYLGANPIASCAAVSALTNLASLDLDSTLISSVDCLAGLSRLGYLNLASDPVSNLAPLAALTQLTMLNLNATPGTNFNLLSGLTNLASFSGYACGLTDLSFVSGWTGLGTLDVSGNRLTDLRALAGLTNLQSLWAIYDRLTNITALQDLPLLNSVALSGNLLDLSPGSAAMGVIQSLQGRGVTVSYQPQDQPPTLSVRSAWTIAANTTSYLSLSVSDDLDNPGQLLLHAGSSNPGLVPEGTLQLTGTNASRFLAVTPAPNQTGSTTIMLTATDTAGQRTHTNIIVTVRWATNVAFADPNLEAFLRRDLDKPLGTFTTIDLEGLTRLEAGWRNLRDVSGLELAPDLRQLFLDGNWIANAVSLARLTQLTDLHVAYNQISDVTPLLGLTNLQFLNLAGNPVTNAEVLCGLKSLAWLGLGSLPVTSPAGLACLTNLASLTFEPNTVRDLSLLAGLTHLEGLGLAGNPLPDWGVLSGFTNLVNLSLAGVGLTNVDPVSGLNRLGYLDLGRNVIGDLTPLAGLTKLQALDLSGNPVTNYSALRNLTNLLSLNLTAAGLEDLSQVQGLTWLQELTLPFNRLGDLAGVEDMTNLAWLDASYNRLTNIAPLAALPRLTGVYLYGNRLDLEVGSAARKAIEDLQARGVTVYYQPQREAPQIQVKPAWTIAANRPAWLPFFTQGGTFYEPLAVTVHSSDPDLLPETNVVITQPSPGLSWNLIALPAAGRTGNVSLTLTATEGAGLSTNAVIVVTVEPPLALPDPGVNCPGLAWETAGYPPWTRQTAVTHDGLDAAQSGGEGALLAATVTGPGTLSFWWTLASADPTARAEFSAVCADCRLNGATFLPAGTAWHKETVVLGPGMWALEWAAASGFWFDTISSNTLRLDEVAFTPGDPRGWLEVVKPPPDARFWLNLHGVPGGSYALETSGDLRTWWPLAQMTLEGFESSYSDPNIEAGARFYRLRRQ